MRVILQLLVRQSPPGRTACPVPGVDPAGAASSGFTAPAIQAGGKGGFPTRGQLEVGPLTGERELVSQGRRGGEWLSFVLGQQPVEGEAHERRHRRPQRHPQPEGGGSQLHGVQVPARKHRKGP